MTNVPFEIRMGAPVETPWGTLKICGHGITGNEISGVTFGDPCNPVGRWSPKHGFETMTAMRCRLWDEQLSALKPGERKLLGAVFAEEIVSEKRHTLKAPAKLVNVAKARLIKSGKLEYKTCSRCGGCGRYSFNLMDRDVCYGCGGTGKAYPSTKEALQAVEC